MTTLITVGYTGECCTVADFAVLRFGYEFTDKDEKVAFKRIVDQLLKLQGIKKLTWDDLMQTVTSDKTTSLMSVDHSIAPVYEKKDRSSVYSVEDLKIEAYRALLSVQLTVHHSLIAKITADMFNLDMMSAATPLYYHSQMEAMYELARQAAVKGLIQRGKCICDAAKTGPAAFSCKSLQEAEKSVCTYFGDLRSKARNHHDDSYSSNESSSHRSGNGDSRVLIDFPIVEPPQLVFKVRMQGDFSF
jgi:hypothetical protein